MVQSGHIQPSSSLENKLVDVYREKPIRLVVKVAVPVKEHPKVGYCVAAHFQILPILSFHVCMRIMNNSKVSSKNHYWQVRKMIKHPPFY